LTRALGRPILVANAGKSGNLTLHHEYQLAHYRHADSFGRVIIMCGMNDAGALLRNNYRERKEVVDQEALENPVGDGAYYKRSTILRLFYGLRRAAQNGGPHVHQDFAGKWYSGMRSKRKALLVKNTIREMPPDLPEALVTYRNNLLRIIDHCRNQNQKLLFLTQPTLYAPDMSREISGLLWEHTDRGAHSPEVLAKVLEAYNNTLWDVCQETGVPCIDLALFLPKDTSILYDDCHFNISGCEMVADILSDNLLPDRHVQYSSG